MSIPIIVGVGKLDCLGYLTLKPYVFIFIHLATIPERVRRTDRIAVAITRLALCAVARKNLSFLRLLLMIVFILCKATKQTKH